VLARLGLFRRQERQRGAPTTRIGDLDGALVLAGRLPAEHGHPERGQSLWIGRVDDQLSERASHKTARCQVGFQPLRIASRIDSYDLCSLRASWMAGTNTRW